MLEKASSPAGGSDGKADLSPRSFPAGPAGGGPSPAEGGLREGELPPDSPGSPGSCASPGGDAAPPVDLPASPGETEPPLDLTEETVGAEATVGGGEMAAAAAADASLAWQDGSIVAERFRVSRSVGQGGMGKVYLAQDEILGRPIALKRIPQEILFDGDARDDLRHEANRLLDLAHENIVRVHTYYDGPTWPFFAMEYLQGPTLKKLLHERKEQGRTFRPPELLAVARQVARGLAYAHAKGVIHRDLKPSNLMLADSPGEEIGDSDVVKITDFGVSRVIADGTLRQTGQRTGTLPYMSPEQFRGEPSTVQSDIYSFACTLYELWSGKPPFHMGDIGYQLLHVPPKPLPGLPRVLSAAILRGLAKDPASRYRSVDEFIDQLEGRRRRTALIPSAAGSPLGGLLSSSPPWKEWKAGLAGAVVAIAIAVVVFVLFEASAARRRGSPPAPGGAKTLVQGSAIHSMSPLRGLAPEVPDRDLDRFRRRLREELRRQIPRLVGHALASTRGSPGVMALGFTFSVPESNLERSLVDALLLQFYRAEDAGENKEVVTVPGKDRADGRKEFVLEPLREGSYTLKAYLKWPGAPPQSILPLLDDDFVQFRVDLSPPAFQVEVVNPRAFLEPLPPYRTTFDEVIDLRLDSPDIAEAHSQIVFNGGVRPWEPIEDPFSWRLVLPPGTSTYRVYAKDAAQNRSHSLEVSFHRLKLGIESFELAYPVWGNLVHVKGVLFVEGEQSPSLKYFVNDQSIQPEPSSGRLASADEPWKPMTEGGGMPFSALLRLPDPANTIEVRYSWNGNPAKPFARPARIPDVVRVKAPLVTISELPERTNSPRIFLEGRVEPYFDGLDVKLENVGQGTVWLTLQRSSGGDYASFSRDIELIPDQENTIRIECYYRDRPLAAASGLRTVICDRRKPSLHLVRCEPLNTDYLSVVIHPSEQLRQLRIKEIAGKDDRGEWRVVEPDLFSLIYHHITAVPVKPVTFQLELTDLAGNVDVLDARPSILPPVTVAGAGSGEAARVTAPEVEGEAGLASAASRDETGAVQKPRTPESTASSGFLAIQSEFLKSMGMKFHPFGHERLEMSLYEVPEKPWFSFLRERAGQAGAGATGAEGRTDHPMTLGDAPPDLLREFVKWVEAKSRDGYTYSIPTREEWIAAFTGMSDPDRAEAALADWFRRSFNPSPGERYGINKAYRIGSRLENRTPTDLSDMEANVQEVILDGEALEVIGGTNWDTEADTMLHHCLHPRPYNSYDRRLTGFRLLRKPAR